MQTGSTCAPSLRLLTSDLSSARFSSRRTIERSNVLVTRSSSWSTNDLNREPRAAVSGRYGGILIPAAGSIHDVRVRDGGRPAIHVPRIMDVVLVPHTGRSLFDSRDSGKLVLPDGDGNFDPESSDADDVTGGVEVLRCL